MPNPARIDYQPAGDALTVRLEGDWTLNQAVPELSDLGPLLNGVRRVQFDAGGLGEWDSALLSLLLRLRKVCDAQKIEVDATSLPKGVQSLVKLATAVPETETSRHEETMSFAAHVGTITIHVTRDMIGLLTFLGESILVFGRLLGRKARFQRSDLWLFIQQAGAEALLIVSVITFLIGLILAFIGALQLAKFGAEIYVADLVGVGMTREMAPLMTAIIMAGRTGAAYAAQLGTMTVNEEIDALRTFGIPPMDFLVLPRMLALMLMMPLLALYGMGLGMLAGGFSAWGVMDISPTEYLVQTETAVGLVDITVGLVKASVFGALVAICGCMRGMQSGRNAAAVGQAATSAVVTSIVLIIAVDAIITVITQLLGI